jgi:hypothetical protein
MSKPRKKYKPKYVARNPLTQFFGGMSSEHAEHLQTLKLKNHAAMAAMVEGRAGRTEWDMLVGAVNMGNVMCDMRIGDEFRNLMLAGRDALCEVGKRAHKTDRFLFKGDKLQAMNLAMEVHDAQLENIRAIDVERASDEVIRRIRNRINTTSVRAEIEKEAV